MHEQAGSISYELHRRRTKLLLSVCAILVISGIVSNSFDMYVHTSKIAENNIVTVMSEQYDDYGGIFAYAGPNARAVTARTSCKWDSTKHMPIKTILFHMGATTRDGELIVGGELLSEIPCP